tara:strand:+ start:750 stop:1013 length:264 start_codon:yes stop_codon:yes gene_type:complete
MSDEETVVPETADNLSDYELYINDEWVTVVTETIAEDIEMACPTCGDTHADNLLFLLDGGQYLYKGLCCGMFAVVVANGEDNGLETE